MSIAWSNTETNGQSVKAVCSSGTETFGQGATDGVNIANLRAIGVIVDADSAQTLSGAGTLQCWYQGPITGLWSRMSDLDLSVSLSSVRSQAYASMQIPASRGRIAWVPSSVTVSAGGLTIYINGVPLARGYA